MAAASCVLTALLATFWLQADAAAVPTKSERFNFFDVELLQAAVEGNAGNVLISPASAKSLLAMLLEGARGVSATELRRALRLPDGSELTRRQLFLRSTNGANLETANSIFAAGHLQLQREFEDILTTLYNSSVRRVEFSAPEAAAAAINGWASAATHGLIPSVIQAGNIDPGTQLLLTNALYFKGKWKTAFDRDGTNVRCFYSVPGKCRKTSMMESLDYYKFAHIDALDAQVVELPYDQGRYAMLVLLPNKANGLPQLVRDLPHRSLHNVLAGIEPLELLVSLPRFSINYRTNLVHALSQIGIKDVFGPGADLSAMTVGHSDLHVSSVFHVTRMDVDEEGTTAAAVSGASVVPLIGSVIPKFIVDRPFLVFVRDTVTGSYLFAGQVVFPQEKEAVPEIPPDLEQLVSPDLEQLTAQLMTQHLPTTSNTPVLVSSTAAKDRTGQLSWHNQPTPRTVLTRQSLANSSHHFVQPLRSPVTREHNSQPKHKYQGAIMFNNQE